MHLFFSAGALLGNSLCQLEATHVWLKPLCQWDPTSGDQMESIREKNTTIYIIDVFPQLSHTLNNQIQRSFETWNKVIRIDKCIWFWCMHLMCCKITSTNQLSTLDETSAKKIPVCLCLHLLEGFKLSGDCFCLFGSDRASQWWYHNKKTLMHFLVHFFFVTFCLVHYDPVKNTKEYLWVFMTIQIQIVRHFKCNVEIVWDVSMTWHHKHYIMNVYSA